MTAHLWQFLYMGGHGFYVWSAYGAVLALMSIQWFIPWQRWRKYLREHHSTHGSHE